MADNDTSSALSSLGQSPLKITPGARPGALPSVALTPGATIDPTTSTSILSNLEKMIAERQSPYQQFRQDIDTMLAHTGYMPTERIKADAEMRQAREAELANLVMSKASLESGLKQGEAIRQFLNTPTGGAAAGAGAAPGGAGSSPLEQMIASLPGPDQPIARLLAATDLNALYKMVHENQMKRPDTEKLLKYADTLPAEQREILRRQILEKGYGIQERIDPATGEKIRFSVPIIEPGAKPVGMSAEDWAKSQGIQISPKGGTRTFEDQLDQFLQNPDLAAVPGTSAHEKGRAIDVPTQSRTPEVKAKLEKAGFVAPLPNEPWHYELRKGATVPAATSTPSNPIQTPSAEAVEMKQKAGTESLQAFFKNDYPVITEAAKIGRERERLAQQVLDNLEGNNFGPGTTLNQKLAEYYQIAGGKLEPKEAEKFVQNMTIETARKFLSAAGARQAMGAQFTAQEADSWLKAFAGIDNPKEYIKNFYQLEKAGALVDQDLKDFLSRNKGREQDAYVQWQDSGAKDRIMRENVDAFKKGKPGEKAAAPVKKTIKFGDLKKD